MVKDIIQGFVSWEVDSMVSVCVNVGSTYTRASAQSNSAETGESVRAGSLPFDRFRHAGSRVRPYIQVICEPLCCFGDPRAHYGGFRQFGCARIITREL